MLGREPENEAVIEDKLGTSDAWALVKRFMGSDEFIRRTASRPLRVDVPASDIDVVVSPEQLELLRQHVQLSWERLGNRHAHFSVITDAAYLPDQFASNEAAFWTSGRENVSWLLRVLARHGMTALDKKTCIDFGCGVGRLTEPLADHFASVDAYDISQPHLEIARQRLAGRRNVAFSVVRNVPIPLPPADVFFSLIVLQHNPPPIIALLIKDALQSLRPGGIAVFQVPTYELGYTFKIGSYLKSKNFRRQEMEMHCIPQRDVFRIAQDVGCHPLEVREQDVTNRFGSDVSNVFIFQWPG